MRLPGRLRNARGEIRRVGFEIEFGGLELEPAGRALAEAVEGRLALTGELTAEVESRWGTFGLELDSSFFQRRAYGAYLDGLGALGRGLERALIRLGEVVIPFEIVTPPLPITDMDVVERVRETLLRHAAKGATSAPFRAFGLQLNPEVPDFRAATLVTYLKAYFHLEPHLREAMPIPFSRRLAPYIHQFPAAYVRLVCDRAYRPGLRRLMVDYLEMNPTRNRPLDLLPLFAELDRELVLSYPVERELVKPRPTFHYRLPSSQVHDPRWSIAREWERWLEVERLAERLLGLEPGREEAHV